LKVGCTNAEIEEIIEQLLDNCERADPYPILDVIIRDPTDIPILSAAVSSNSDLLVTGDKDLLDLVDPPVRILSPRQLHDLLFPAP
jgi:putative PIN family toxin of toxin-antitoxin system